MNKFILLPVTLFALLFAIGCGSGSSGPAPKPVGNFTNASLSGSYAYVLSGVDIGNNFAPYREAGVFTADGNGNITGTDDFTENSSIGTSPTTGQYSINADGTGTLALTFTNSNPLTTFTFSVTLSSSSKLYLIEEDTLNTYGVAELQNTSAIATTPSGTFVFKMHPVASTLGLTSMVGQMSIASGAITGTADIERGAAFQASSALTGSVSAPDATGRGTGTFTDAGGIITNFMYYVVDGNNLRFLLNGTSAANTTTGVGLGRAEAQTGGPFSATSFAGNYAFGSRGDDATYLNGVNTVGTFTAGNGTLTGGAYDSVADGTSIATGTAFGGTYAVDPTGRVTVSLSPFLGSTSQQIYWLVSPSRAYSISMDSTKAEDGTIDLQQGTFSNSSISGQYAFVMDGSNLNNSPPQIDRVGWINGDGNGNMNLFEGVNVAATSPPFNTTGTLTGTYTVGSNGRATATIALGTFSQNNNDLVFYLVSPSKAYLLQNDPGVEVIGSMDVQ